MISKYFGLPLVAAAVLSLGLLTGCDDHSNSNNTQTTAYSQSSAGDSGSDFNSRPSDAPRINVQQVQDALAQVQQSDPQGWLQDFEQRVNQIYDGNDVVSIDAHPDASGNLQIIGYISKSGQQGYQAGVDDELFSIQQTGAVANNDAPYRMTYYTYGGGAAYYDGYYHNPFLTAWFINSMMYHSWGGYYTSPARITVISSYRTTYRTTPAYAQQRMATRDYYTQTYHGAPVTVRPGSSIGAGVTVRPGAAVAPSRVTPPAAYHPSANFNRGSGTPYVPHATAPSTYTPRAAGGSPSVFNRPSASRSGGLFGGSSGYSRPSSGFRSSGGSSFRRH